MVWIRLHRQPDVQDDCNILRMMTKEISLVLLVQVHMRLDSGPWVPMQANCLHNLPTFVNGNMDLALAESHWPKLQFYISTNCRRWVVWMLWLSTGLNTLTVDAGNLLRQLQYAERKQKGGGQLIPFESWEQTQIWFNLVNLVEKELWVICAFDLRYLRKTGELCSAGSEWQSYYTRALYCLIPYHMVRGL